MNNTKLKWLSVLWPCSMVLGALFLVAGVVGIVEGVSFEDWIHGARCFAGESAYRTEGGLRALLGMTLIVCSIALKLWLKRQAAILDADDESDADDD